MGEKEGGREGGREKRRVGGGPSGGEDGVEWEERGGKWKNRTLLFSVTSRNVFSGMK